MNQTKAALVVLGLLVGCGESGGGAGPQAKVASDFAADDDGWTVRGDAQATSVKPDYNGTGGNPDGLISAKDDVTGGIFYFVAPPKYHVQAGDVFGRAIRYDIKTTRASNPFEAWDVIVVGSGKSIATTLPIDPVPVDTWHTVRVPFDSTGGWKVAPTIDDQENPTPLPDATEADLRAVLANVTGLYIRGEFNTGADTGSLDNVRFGEP